MPAGHRGEHLAKARELLTGLESITGDQGGDAQTRATAACANAILALAEQITLVRQDLAAGPQH